MNPKANILTIESNKEIELQKGVCGSTEITTGGTTFDLTVNLEIGEHAILTLDVSPQGEIAGRFEEVHISLCPSGEYNVSVFVDEPFHDVTDPKEALRHLAMRKVVLAGIEYIINFAHREQEVITNLLSNFLEMEEQAALQVLEESELKALADYENTSKEMRLISDEMAEHYIKVIQDATDDYDDGNGFRLDVVIPHHEQRFVEHLNVYKSGGLYFVGQNIGGKYKTRQIELERVIWYIKNTYC